MKKIITIFGILVLALALTACGDKEKQEEQDSSGDKVEENDLGELINEDELPEVIATVNGEEIDKDVFVYTMKNMLGSQVSDANSEEIDEMVETLKAQLVDRMVNERMLIQAAEKSGVEVSDEEIEEMMTPFTSQFENEKEMEAALSEEGITMDDLRADVEKMLMLDKYINKEVEIEEITEDDLKVAYDEASALPTEEELPPFDEYKETLKAQIEYERQEQQINELIEELREESEVVIHI